jgi:small GTP-binding protein
MGDDGDSGKPGYKVVLLGEAGVGKTSSVIRYTQDTFVENQPGTVGSAIVQRSAIRDGREIILSIWDTAGQERYRSLMPMYARGAAVAMIFFDVTDLSTFETINDWISQVQTVLPTCGIVIVGNKCDRPYAQPRDDYEQWASREGRTISFTSAKTGEGIAEAFELVISKLPVERPDTPGALDGLSSGGQTRYCC